jgi:hypothetical protein
VQILGVVFALIRQAWLGTGNKLIIMFMKSKLIIAFIFFGSFGYASNSKDDIPGCIKFNPAKSIYQDTTLAYLMTLNLEHYKAKPVDSLLSVLPGNFTQRKIHGTGNLKIANVLSVRYSGNIRVLIFVTEFTHMNPRSETLQWNINLFRQEKIDCIEIWNGNTFVSSIRCRKR